ncbi:MAG: phage tail spike protein, partial [Porcipelethomonas sp.]
LAVERGFYNEKNVTCEGCLGYLLDSVQRPYEFTASNKISPESLLRFYISRHNEQMELHSSQLKSDAVKKFKLGVVNVAAADGSGFIVCSDNVYLNTWDSIQEKLISVLGGFLNVRYEEDGNYIDYLSYGLSPNSQTIEFGKNLIDFKCTENSDETATIIIPIGGELDGKKVTIADLPVDSQSPDICKKDDYIYSKKGIEKYGRITKAVCFEDEINPLFLRSAAEKFLADSLNSIESIELTAADLSAVNADIESFEIGKEVNVVSKPHGISAQFEVTTLEINLKSPSQNRLLLGTQEDTITSQRSAGSASVSGYYAGGGTYKAGTGLEMFGSTINHKNMISAGTAGDFPDGTLKYTDSLQIPVISYDAEGHISGVKTRAVNIPQCYIHQQTSGAKVWVIYHGLERYPSVTIKDETGETVFCDIEYTNTNCVTLKFSEATAGTAYLN